nr:response regulator [Rhizobium sp. Q54]
MSDTNLSGSRVLLVEDEGLIAMHMTDLLEEIGCSVVGPAATVEEALSLLNGADVDAALLDVNLGDGATSYPVADALAAKAIPFAFLTGYGAVGLDQAYKDQPVLAKPVEEGPLIEAVSALILQA